MISKAETVQQYLAQLPAARRAVMEGVRRVVLENLDKGFEEGMLYGMLGYYVPLRSYPAGYMENPKQPLGYLCVAAQKGYYSLYLNGVYCGCWGDGADKGPDARRFRQDWLATGKKLNMGKSCVRFKELKDVPLAVVGQMVARFTPREYIARYEATRRATAKP